MAAGGDTTGGTISTLLYHLVANPDKLDKLRSALGPIFRENDVSYIPSSIELEKVAYMTAVVKEGLRIHHGVSARLARCAPDRDIHYGELVIPRNTPISMCIPDVHDDPKIFPEPRKFTPERWLKTTKDGVEAVTGLDRFLVAFCKGTRQCLGMKSVSHQQISNRDNADRLYSLAMAEIYIAIATIVMRFDFELFETTSEDVEYARDLTLPHPKLDSKYVRVLVK